VEALTETFGNYNQIEREKEVILDEYLWSNAVRRDGSVLTEPSTRNDRG
jgi:hypothetical protein